MTVYGLSRSPTVCALLGDKDIWKFEYGKLLVPKYVHQKLQWIMQKLLIGYEKVDSLHNLMF
jgi:hypothetical protein